VVANGVWSVVGDPYCGDRQDFVHKLEFEVSKGKIGRGVTSTLWLLAPGRRYGWLIIGHDIAASYRTEEMIRAGHVLCHIVFLWWDSKYNCTTLQCACKRLPPNIDQIMEEKSDRLMRDVFGLREFLWICTSSVWGFGFCVITDTGTDT